MSNVCSMEAPFQLTGNGLLCRRVREAERYHWAATRGVNEEILLEDLPEDLQRDIRRHLFKFVKRVSPGTELK